eukprot:TRINITY_DN2668_c0_g2_i1.p1 TRINITY_DN2668_c0_g2~~TRINITY_DN2668_c0_g2_i1.p1  ORF type:complete len:380 (-),score=127.46 TRINITY_DN2668_c0_g2_i1:56-1195(-)
MGIDNITIRNTAMRPIIVCIVLALSLLASASAKGVRGVGLRESSGSYSFAFQRSSAFKELAKGELGAQIADTITMMLETGGSFDEVLKMLNELSASLETEQTSDTVEFTTTKSQLEDDIKTNGAKAASALAEYNEATKKLASLVISISHLGSNIISANKQLQILRDERAALEEAHAEDTKEFTQRIGEQRQVAQVLTTIINDLTEKALSSASSFAEEHSRQFKSSSLVEMTNPISALVDLTSTFDLEAVKIIIGKLEQLKEAVEASIQDDEESQARSTKTYELMIEKMQQIEDKLVEDIERMKREESKAKNDVVIETERKETNESLQKKSEEARVASENQLQTITSNYERRSVDRTRALKILKEAINILKTAEASQQAP